MNSRRSLIMCLIAFITVTGFFTEWLYAQQDSFPFVAETTGDSVNVRAGQSANFERLSRLGKGDEVVVLDKEFSWYKIQLPITAKSYVSKKYVQYLGKNAGGITADQVNIRAGAGIHYTVLGQLFRGEQIYILEELPEWYRIEPVAESYGWVTDDFLKFKSEDVSAFGISRPPRAGFEESAQKLELVSVQGLAEEAYDQVIVDEPEVEEIEVQELGSEEVQGAVPEDFRSALFEEPAKAEPETEKIQAAAPPKTERTFKEKLEDTTPKVVKVNNHGVISVVGIIEPHEDKGGDGVYYKIVADGKPVCFVQGVNHMLGRFINHQVAVDGTVNQKLRSDYPSPVINVVKVRLML